MSTDYSKMSDFEINKLVALASGKNKKFISVDADDNEIGVIVGEKCTRQRLPFDPCNSPADAWPIIAENRIGIIPAPGYGEWKAAHRSVGDDSTPHHFTQHTNPFRAAMIVFLKMQEAKNAS